MKIFKTYEIPAVIKIELVGTHLTNALGPIVDWQVRWRFWRNVAVDRNDDKRLVKDWGLQHSSVPYYSPLGAEQAFDIAVARVNSQIVMTGDVAIDIMNDHQQLETEQ